MIRVCALLLMLVAVPALAQEGTRPLDLTSSDLALGALDLGLETRGLGVETRDLVFAVQDMIKVTTAAKEVKIELPADVLFDFDKAVIRPDAVVALAAAADLLRKGVNGAVKIDGHTDSKGTASYNLKLSQDRAKSVQAWFAKNGKLPTTLRFTLTGYGANRPKAPNTKPDGSDDPEGRQINRRVEITFTPK